MRGYNICFHLEGRKIIFELSLLPLLIWHFENVTDCWKCLQILCNFVNSSKCDELLPPEIILDLL